VIFVCFVADLFVIFVLFVADRLVTFVADLFGICVANPLSIFATSVTISS
jgi:hypothetical protein